MYPIMLRNHPKKTKAIQKATGFLALTIKIIEARINMDSKMIMTITLSFQAKFLWEITYSTRNADILLLKKGI